MKKYLRNYLFAGIVLPITVPAMILLSGCGAEEGRTDGVADAGIRPGPEQIEATTLLQAPASDLPQETAAGLVHVPVEDLSRNPASAPSGGNPDDNSGGDTSGNSVDYIGDNPGGNSGGNPGGDPGGDPGDNPGGDPGGNPDDNSGDNPAGSMPLYGDWRSFTTEDGLPSNKVNTVKIDNGRILAGTDRGMAVLENGEWTVYTPEDGLAHRSVLSIDVDEPTGDVWIGTMNGLNRWSAGVFERFDQFNSGLANDVVYEVVCDGRYVWIATTAGANRYDTYTNQWIIFNEETSPLHEPWTYGISTGDNKAYIAAWGGGVVEYNNETGNFRVYRDPDGQFHLTLHPDDGLVHDITTGTAFDNGILWVSTYFGMSKYDGHRWRGFFEHDSGLSSNFINAVKARNSVAYFATDDGLNTFDGTTWVVYNTVEGSLNGQTTITRGSTVRTLVTDSSVAHGFIWNMDAKDDELWVATSAGLSRAKIVGYAENELQ